MSDQFHVEATGIQRCQYCNHEHQTNEKQNLFKYCKGCGHPLREEPVMQINLSIPLWLLGSYEDK